MAKKLIAVLGVLIVSGGVRVTSQTGAVLSSPGQWNSIGPMPIFECPNSPDSGRVSTIAPDPSDLNHWLIGTGNGGVWETRNAGTSWIPLTDGQATLAIGAVAFAPSNPSVIYAATGEAVSVGFAKGGLGLLKSTDGGQNWNLIAAASFARAGVRRVRVHPASPDIVMATAGRAGFGRDSQENTPSPPPFGVLRSTDGGMTWARTLAGVATALEIDSTNFNNQYAAIGDVRVPNFFNDSPGALPNGVYRSTDGGQTWALVSGPWGVSTTSSAPMRRIELAIAPSNPNVLYASMGAPDGSLLGLWRTDNAWAPAPIWSQIPTGATGPGGYCGPTFKCNYSHVISVDPADANRLFAGGSQQGFWRCTNCGVSPAWTDVTANTCLHPDYHSLAWAGTRLIVGNDGGIWSSADLGASWANHNSGLPTNMFFSGALHPTNPNFIMGGLRDFTPAFRLGSGTGWQSLGQPGTGAEWGEAEVAISSTRPDTDWMLAGLFGSIHRTTNGGQTGILADGGINKSGAAFVAPVRKCPSNENIFLTGTTNMWRTNNFFSASPPTWASNGPYGATILAIAYASSDTTCNTYAYGTLAGDVRLTTNGGALWINLDLGHALPFRPVNGLAFDPTNPNILYVGVSSFDVATPGSPGHVFKTTNALAASPTWSNISPPIDVPFNVITIDPRNPRLVYAGSDTGLWHSIDSGATWFRDGLTTGLPNAPVYDIQINPLTDRTVVFTYGRGAYVLTSPCTYSLNVTSSTFGPAGGSGAVNVTAPASCAWNAFSNNGFVTVTGGSSGAGNGAVTYAVASNTGPPDVTTPDRVGTITIAGQTFSVNQIGCSFGIGPTAETFGASGGSDQVGVSTPTPCQWTVAGVPAWAATQSGGSGTGPGAWLYAVAANGTGSTRSQAMTVGGQAFSLRQLAVPVTAGLAGAPTSFTLANASTNQWSSLEMVQGRSYCGEIAPGAASVTQATPTLVAFRADALTVLASGPTSTRKCFVAPATETALLRVTQADPSARVYRMLVTESTLWANWFFIGGPYSSFTLLRNTTATMIHAQITWRSSTTGAAVGSLSADIPSYGTVYFDARSYAATAATGSVEVAHDGEPQAIVGSQTTLAPTTGLSFDTLMMQRRPR